MLFTPPSNPTLGLRLPVRYETASAPTCTLIASPTLVSDENPWVEVQVRQCGIPAHGKFYASSDDWVGLFGPDDFTPEGALLRFPARWQHANTTCWPREAVASPREVEDTGSRESIVGQPGARCDGEACCAPNNYTSTGEATLRFKLVNLRTPYVFALVRGSMQFSLTAGTSRAVSFARASAPTQLHIALTRRPDELLVSWTSSKLDSELDSALQPERPGAMLRWGTSPGVFDAGVASGVSTTYTREDLCSAGGPARTLGWRDPGALWRAAMGPLEPGVRYWYTVGSDAAGWSHERAGGLGNFSVVGPSPSRRSVRVLAFGDMGNAPSLLDGTVEQHNDDTDGRGQLGSLNTSRAIAADVMGAERAGTAPPDAVLHIGDLSYARGYAPIWDEFMSQIEPAAARVPWMSQDGNHERNCPCHAVSAGALSAGINWLDGYDSGGECGVPYDARFPMPYAAEGKRWYVVELGVVAAVMMSTEHDFSAGSAQLADLDAMLGAVDRAAHPWLIVAGHRPMYNEGKWPEPSTGPLQALVEPLMLKHGVDLAMWGHHHSYQRSCEMASGRCVGAGERGVTHVIIGNAGFEFTPLETDVPGGKAPDWMVFQNNTRYGLASITADEASLHFGMVRSDGMGVLDEFTLKKAPDEAPRAGARPGGPSGVEAQ